METSGSDPDADGDSPFPARWRVPSPDRLAPTHPRYDEVLRRHEEAMREGRSLYEDPGTGLWVMTAAVLASRRCCENGCRHCPHVDRADG